MPLHDKPVSNYPHERAYPRAVVAWLMGDALVNAGCEFSGKKQLELAASISRVSHTTMKASRAIGRQWSEKMNGQQ